MDQTFVIALLLYAMAGFLSAPRRDGWIGVAFMLGVGIVLGRPGWEIVAAVSLAFLLWRRDAITDLAKGRP